MQDAHAVHDLLGSIDGDLRPDAAETGEVVDPQGHRDAVLAMELARETPADADVAEIVDHLAENGECRGALIVVHGCADPKKNRSTCPHARVVCSGL
jgi:hypothetical protein